MSIAVGDPRRPSVWFSRSIVELLAGSAIGMAGGFAVTFLQSFGVFLGPISRDLGWGRTEASLISTMGFLGYCLASPLLGVLIDRFGARRVIGAGIVLFPAGLSSFAILPGKPAWFAVASFAIGAIGATTAPSGYVLVIAKSVRNHLGLAIGLAMLGLGIGASTIQILAQGLIDRFGWRSGYIGLSSMALTLGGIAWSLAFRRPPVQGSVTNTPPSAASLKGVTLTQALRSYRFWVIALSGLAISSAAFGTMTHLASAMTDRGISPNGAARVAGMAGLGILLARTGSAVLMDWVFAPLVACVTFITGGVGLAALAYVSAKSPLLLLAAFATGFLTGTEGDVMPLVAKRYFGTAAFGAIYGCIVGIVSLGGIIGPLAFGVAFDRTGDYRWILIAGGIGCLLSAVAMMALGRYRFPEAGRS